METKNNSKEVISTEVVKMRLNVDFLNFVKEVKNESNLETIKSKYIAQTRLAWSNRDKIIKRTNRPELSAARDQVLKGLGVTPVEYQKIIEKLQASRNCNYIEVTATPKK